MNNTIAITKEDKKELLIQTWQLYLIISIASIILSFAFQKFIMTKEVYYTLYGNQMEDYRIDNIISFMHKLQIWRYVATPVLIWFRLAFVAFLIQLPLMIKYIEIPFKEIFRITAFAFLALFAADLTKFFYLYFLHTTSITADTLTFVPLAITNFLNKSNYSNLVFSFLGKINVFEFIWIYVIYRGLYKTGKIEKIDALLVSMGVWTGILILTFALTMFLRTLG